MLDKCRVSVGRIHDLQLRNHHESNRIQHIPRKKPPRPRRRVSQLFSLRAWSEPPHCHWYENSRATPVVPAKAGTHPRPPGFRLGGRNDDRNAAIFVPLCGLHKAIVIAMKIAPVTPAWPGCPSQRRRGVGASLVGALGGVHSAGMYQGAASSPLSPPMGTPPFFIPLCGLSQGHSDSDRGEAERRNLRPPSGSGLFLSHQV